MNPCIPAPGPRMADSAWRAFLIGNPGWHAPLLQTAQVLIACGGLAAGVPPAGGRPVTPTAPAPAYSSPATYAPTAYTPSAGGLGQTPQGEGMGFAGSPLTTGGGYPSTPYAARAGDDSLQSIANDGGLDRGDDKGDDMRDDKGGEKNGHTPQDVPEPATLLVLLAGLAGLWRIRRTRR